MKNLIKKILKEGIDDFDWANQIDPLQSFEDYFYGNYKMNTSQIKVGKPGQWIKRDITWWKNWIHDVEMSHASFLEDVDEFRDMVQDLVNPRDGSKKYHQLADDIYQYVTPKSALGGKSFFQDLALTIDNAYTELGPFAEDNNLTILETLDIFKQWLDKREKEGKPLHKEL
jgi:hypothetical protein